MLPPIALLIITRLQNAYWNSLVVPGTATIRRRRRRQSIKPQVEVKSMNHLPAADCASCRRRRRRRWGRLLVDLMHFVQLYQRIFGNVFNVAC